MRKRQRHEKKNFLLHRSYQNQKTQHKKILIYFERSIKKLKGLFMHNKSKSFFKLYYCYPWAIKILYCGV